MTITRAGAVLMQRFLPAATLTGLETELNAQVYALFDLSPEEIEVIERATKYQYGEV